jgi:hypothetical protein
VRGLRADRLADAALSAVSDPALRERAIALAPAVRGERGLDEAVASIERATD